MTDFWAARKAHGNPKRKSNPAMDFETRALQKLAKLPRLNPSVWDKQDLQRESGDQRRTPFKGAQTAGAGKLGHFLDSQLASRYGSYNKALSDAPLKKVSIGSLHGVQPGVHAAKVAGKIREIAQSDETEAPSVVRYKKRLYLLDGYHSLTALKLGGVKSIEAYVMSL